MSLPFNIVALVIVTPFVAGLVWVPVAVWREHRPARADHPNTPKEGS